MQLRMLFSNEDINSDGVNRFTLTGLPIKGCTRGHHDDDSSFHRLLQRVLS